MDNTFPKRNPHTARASLLDFTYPNKQLYFSGRGIRSRNILTNIPIHSNTALGNKRILQFSSFIEDQGYRRCIIDSEGLLVSTILRGTLALTYSIL